MRSTCFALDRRLPARVLGGRPGRGLPAHVGGQRAGHQRRHHGDDDVHHSCRSGDERDIPHARARTRSSSAAIPNFFRRSALSRRSARSRSRGARSNCATRARSLARKAAGSSSSPIARCFFSATRRKARAGYELTMVELILDAQGCGHRHHDGRGAREADTRRRPRRRRVRSRAREAHRPQGSGKYADAERERRSDDSAISAAGTRAAAADTVVLRSSYPPSFITAADGTNYDSARLMEEALRLVGDVVTETTSAVWTSAAKG